ncbi:TadE/TadG family type IV pilus assembly protein [Aureimonas pseudogalii]|nr:TadE/TadG family type IV pilus assembly protein [Aureimonas pseudogalii]
MDRLAKTDIGRLARCRRGNVSIIVALTIMPLTIMAGSAVDLVRFERARISLQTALDRGTVAAASLTQMSEPRPVVESFLGAVYTEDQKLRLDVTSNVTLNSRKVTASATVTLPTFFLHLANVAQLTVHARSVAEEARKNVELSMVLDISGSMVSNGGLAQLKPAAKSFLDIVLKPELAAQTSVSIVPFSGEVNVGQRVFDHLAGSGNPRQHLHSSCFEMGAGDFNENPPDFTRAAQVPHFNRDFTYKGTRMPWCPQEETSIAYLQNDKNGLKRKIDELVPYDGTGTMYAMKWGEMLLNPKSNGLVNAIISKKLAPIQADFADRPFPFDDERTLKFILLMTDGDIVDQPRPTKPNPIANMLGIRGQEFETIYSSKTAYSLFDKVCDYAKAKKIKIFTIAFKVNETIAKNIAKCASNSSYAYRIDGLDMNAAFQNIATTMQKLRIVE